MRSLRWLLVVFTTLLLQTTLVADLELFGARGDIVLLLVIAAGIAGGPDTGAWAGFTAGLAFDLLLQTPFGLSALAYALAGYFVGILQGGVLRSSWWIPVLSALAGSVAGVSAFVLGGEMLGQDNLLTGDLPVILLVVALCNALFVLPALRVARWLIVEHSPRLALHT